MSPRGGVKKSTKSKTAETYQHPESTSPMRPEVGTQAQFKKKKAPQKYRYDDSLSPALEWDGNLARERGEGRIAKAEQELAEAQKALAEITRVAQAPSPVSSAPHQSAQPGAAVPHKPEVEKESYGTGALAGEKSTQPGAAVPHVKEAAQHVADAQEAVRELKAMSKPFLNWAGKAERLSFDVPTLPLFIHERLSTKAILET